MGVYQTVENRLNFFFRAVVTVWAVFFAMTFMIVLLALPDQPAHSMVVLSKPLPPSISVQSADNSDPCRVLLHSVNTSDSTQALLQKTGVYALNRSQSSPTSKAGKTAALAFMLGKRFAISPNPTRQAGVQNAIATESVRSTKSRTTHSIVAYRQCKKDIALKALGNR